MFERQCQHIDKASYIAKATQKRKAEYDVSMTAYKKKQEKAPYLAKSAHRKVEYDVIMTAYKTKQQQVDDEGDIPEDSEKSESELNDDDDDEEEDGEV
ncbi:hypothetical protein SUGI_0213890 [Cryptomeria japonica]|nr:hypothetical protein SUGI_0213890 [Cryptomeria japonica]